MIAITGCARSGTAYASELLRRLGYDVGHEELRADGIVSWPLAAATLSAPWGPSPAKVLTICDVVLHQVREPMAAIRSIHTLAERSWKFVCETTPCRPDDPLLVRSAKYWLHWNRMSEKVASRTYRLESIRDELPAIVETFDRPPERFDVDSVPRANARADVSGAAGWGDLVRASKSLADEVAELAARYGYDPPGA